MEIQETPPLPEKESARKYGHSGPLVTGSKTRSFSSARFKNDDNDDDRCYVEVTLDFHDDDTFVLRNIKGADRTSSSRSLASQLSFKLKKVSHELKRMKSNLSFKKAGRPIRPGVGRALKGFKFMTKNVCSEGWPEIETRFDDLAGDGTLPKSLFDQCIGMQDSSQFGCEVFDALARRRGITSCCVTKEELREFWEQISDHSFNARLQTFFDM